MFCEAWESQLCDMALLLREINDVFEGRRGTSLPSQRTLWSYSAMLLWGTTIPFAEGEVKANTELSHLIRGGSVLLHACPLELDVVIIVPVNLNIFKDGVA